MKKSFKKDFLEIKYLKISFTFYIIMVRYLDSPNSLLFSDMSLASVYEKTIEKTTFISLDTSPQKKWRWKLRV